MIFVVYFVPETTNMVPTTDAAHSVGDSQDGRFRKPFRESVIALADPISPTANPREVCVHSNHPSRGCRPLD
jgi:hypothetical protein